MDLPSSLPQEGRRRLDKVDRHIHGTQFGPEAMSLPGRTLDQIDRLSLTGVSRSGRRRGRSRRGRCWLGRSRCWLGWSRRCGSRCCRRGSRSIRSRSSWRRGCWRCRFGCGRRIGWRGRVGTRSKHEVGDDGEHHDDCRDHHTTAHSAALVERRVNSRVVIRRARRAGDRIQRIVESRVLRYRIDFASISHVGLLRYGMLSNRQRVEGELVSSLVEAA